MTFLFILLNFGGIPHAEPSQAINVGAFPSLYYMLVTGKERKEKDKERKKLEPLKTSDLPDYYGIFETFFF